ncbi:MAG: acetyl-CoA carboxylase carboxyltransferase subunit, partial [Leptospiraceae bacterium]|nr:acetyl-CoA carboxylase carboxyltransferase subunit [Leptospiraceae bacterium]
NLKKGAGESEAKAARDSKLAELSMRYEKNLMNPKEALSLGSVSSVVMPGYTRNVLGRELNYLISHYKPESMSGVQREFE